ncbi:hypothetical protein MTR67_051249 [Solanum verrucosum]|uniref:Uncharacterized protein n=1 Tax=Solanum verrucosum TaxID=315347 RepID=A0AAF0V5W1_SOLVR|nr:hypothetical protein MTR67_051249 [Solanum verrucosum]
MKVFLIKRFQ